MKMPGAELLVSWLDRNCHYLLFLFSSSSWGLPTRAFSALSLICSSRSWTSPSVLSWDLKIQWEPPIGWWFHHAVIWLVYEKLITKSIFLHYLFQGPSWSWKNLNVIKLIIFDINLQWLLHATDIIRWYVHWNVSSKILWIFRDLLLASIRSLEFSLWENKS